MPGKLAVRADRHGDGDQAAEAHPPPLGDGRTVGGKDDVPVEHQLPDPRLVDLFGLAGRQADHVAILLDERLGTPCAEREPRMLGQVARLAVDGDDDLRPHPFVHLRPARAGRDGPRRGRAPAAR